MTAHDPRVTLTEAEIERIVDGQRGLRVSSALFEAIADVIAQREAARLAPIRALEARYGLRARTAPEYDADIWAEVESDLRNALDAPQDAPRGPVGGEQGAEVAGGRSEGEGAGEGDLDGFEYTLSRRELRQIKAETWHEGHDTCCGVALRFCAHAVNPYREDAR